MTPFPVRLSVCVGPGKRIRGEGSDLLGKGQTLNTAGDVRVETTNSGRRRAGGGRPRRVAGRLPGNARPRGGPPCFSAPSSIYAERATRDRGRGSLGTGACVQGGQSGDTLGAGATASGPPLSAGSASTLAVTGRSPPRGTWASGPSARASRHPESSSALGAAPSEPDSPRGAGPRIRHTALGPGPSEPPVPRRKAQSLSSSFLGRRRRIPHQPASLSVNAFRVPMSL